MKKLKICLLFIILLLPLSVFAETCDTNNVIIKDINQTNKSEGTDEKAPATIENNKINLDITMSDVDDYIEYEFNVENKSDEELAFNEKSITSVDNHFTYEFTYEDDSNIIPAHDDKDVTMKITYTKEINESEFENGTYQLEETNKVKVMDPKLINPKTVNFLNMFIIIILGTIAIMGLVIIKNKYMKTFLLLCCLIPSTVYATCSYEIELNPKIEVPYVPKPVSFSTDSWETIIKAVGKGNTSLYNVGDTKTIDMGTFGTHTIRIANKSTPEECSQEEFSQTACGFVLEYEDIIMRRNVNSNNPTSSSQLPGTGNIGGWPATEIREYLNNDIYNSLPSPLKNAIVETNVISGHGTKESSNFTSTDKIYLLSMVEVFGETEYTINYDTLTATKTRQLDYYNNLGTTIMNNSYNTEATYKIYNNIVTAWWLRSPKNDNYYSYIYCYTPYPSYSDGVNQNGVSPAFRIG